MLYIFLKAEDQKTFADIFFGGTSDDMPDIFWYRSKGEGNSEFLKCDW